jgi:hypothetical protein
MVDEIKTLLLNDEKFSRYTYIDDNFNQIRLNKVQSEFRRALLFPSGAQEPKSQVWISNLLVNAIYKDRDLEKIANKNFDTRRIIDESLYSQDFLASVTQNFYDNKIIVKMAEETYPQDGIHNKNIKLSRKNNNVVVVSYSINNQSYENEKEIIFVFKNRISNTVNIPDTRIKIGFSNTSIVPFSSLFLSIKYPYYYDINNTINKIFQIPGLEELIWTDKQSFKELFDLYSKTDRDYKKMLCLILAYSISLSQ